MPQKGVATIKGRILANPKAEASQKWALSGSKATCMMWRLLHLPGRKGGQETQTARETHCCTAPMTQRDNSQSCWSQQGCKLMSLHGGSSCPAVGAGGGGSCCVRRAARTPVPWGPPVPHRVTEKRALNKSQVAERQPVQARWWEGVGTWGKSLLWEMTPHMAAGTQAWAGNLRSPNFLPVLEMFILGTGTKRFVLSPCFC